MYSHIFSELKIALSIARFDRRSVERGMIQTHNDLQTCLGALGGRPLDDRSSWSSTEEYNHVVELAKSLEAAENGTDDVALFQRLAASSLDAAEILQESHDVHTMNGDVLRINVPAGANVAILKEMVALNLNHPVDGDDREPHIDVSQVHVTADLQLLDSILPIPENADRLEAVISQRSWQDDVNSSDMPIEIKKLIQELSRRTVLNRDEGAENNLRTWGEAGEFGPLVDYVKQLCKREKRRGSNDINDETSEIIEVLIEAAARHNASPKSVLEQLQNEFG